MRKLLAVLCLALATAGLTACETNGFLTGGLVSPDTEEDNSGGLDDNLDGESDENLDGELDDNLDGESGDNNSDENNDGQTQSYTITFDVNGGNSEDGVTLEEGATINLPTPTKDDHTFIGWFTDEELTLEFTETTLSSDITLYAKWELTGEQLTYFTITFVSNGGSAVEPKDVLEGNKISTISQFERPTRTSYDFLGWYYDEELTKSLGILDTMNSDITLYAKWQQIGPVEPEEENEPEDTLPEDIIVPTTLEEFLSWLDQDNDNYVMGILMGEGINTIYSYDNNKIEMSVVSEESTLMTMYFEYTEDDTLMIYSFDADANEWVCTPDEDGEGAMMLIFGEMINSNGLTAEDFTDNNDGTYSLISEEEGEEFVITITFNEDGSIEYNMFTQSMDLETEELVVVDITFTYSSFGSSSVTLPSVE